MSDDEQTFDFTPDTCPDADGHDADDVYDVTTGEAQCALCGWRP